MNHSTFRALIPGLRSLLLLLLVSPGCAEFNLRDRMPWLMGMTGEFRRPMRVVAIWTDTVLTVPGQLPRRGFGARLMFYEANKEKPIKVAGTLTVYAFDEQGRAKTDAKPDRKYVFTADQFSKHYSKSELGHSYSVWVPWDSIGGESREISLIVRFEPLEGGAVVSEQVKQFLPGTKPAEPRAGGPYARGAGPSQRPEAVQVSPVQLVNHQAPAFEGPASQPPQEQKMSTTTIALPFNDRGRPPAALVRPRPNRLPGPLGSQPGASGAAIPPANSRPDRASSLPASLRAEASLAERSPTPAGQSWIAHYAQRRSRALGEPIAPLTRDRGPLRPSPAIRPSAPPVGSPPTASSEPLPPAFPTAP